MKKSGRNIKRRLYALSLLRNRLSRVKYFRGYGVHSPFVYSLVRRVFMCRDLWPEQSAPLYDALIERGVAKRRATQLQNLMYYIEAQTFAINTSESASDLTVLCDDVPNSRIHDAYESTAQRGTTLVVMSPYESRERRAECRALIDKHQSTTVDNRAYVIFFNNHLPKQHFRL